MRPRFMAMAVPLFARRSTVIPVALFFSLLHPSISVAEPLVTISCDKPDGFNMTYGVSFGERVEASKNNLPEPTKPSLKGPNKDGYLGKPTFIIDTNRKDMTVVWSELPDDVKLRQQAKELGLPQMPPPPAANATVVLFFDEQISAVLVEPWSIMTFSFFPKLGTAFIGQQYSVAGLNRTAQMSVFAHCEFSWTNPQ
jgi:hypothetical protein